MRFFLFGMACLVQVVLSAQQSTINFREAMVFLENQYQVKFTFDPELVGHVQLQYDETNLSLESFIDQTQSQSALHVKSLGDDYYSIVSEEITYTLFLTDSLEDQPIIEPVVAVNQTPVKLRKEEGHWSFQLEPKADDLVIVYVLGFEDQRLSYDQLLNNKTLRVLMHPKFLQLDVVTVHDYLSKGIDMDPANQSINIKTSNLPLLPGETDGDIFASLAVLPGITNPDNRPGNIYIRGSSTDQSYILYNDIPIFHKGHYYGTISPYNPKIVNEVKVYRNGFHPSIGGRVGGAIEINTDYQPDKDAKVGVGTNTLYGMGYFKLPSKNKKWGISFGARHSYPYSWNSPKLQAISNMVFAATSIQDTLANVLRENLLINFEDYSGSLSFRPNNKNSITLSSIYTQTGISYKANKELNNYSLSNYGSNLKWIYKANEKWHSKLSISLSDYSFNYENKPRPPVFNSPVLYSKNTINDLSANEEISYYFNKLNKIQFGTNLTYQKVFYDSKGTVSTDSVPTRVGGTSAATTISPYLNFEWKNHPKFYLQLGIRGNYYNLLNHFSTAPRMFFNYYPNQYLTLKGSTGIYYQYLSQIKKLEFISGGFDNELWQLANNRTAKIMNGFQSMLGWIINKNKWVIDMEGYFKTANNVAYSSTSKFTNNSFFSYADQQMYGIDFMIKRQVNDNISLWARYSWSESVVIVDTARQKTYTSQYSQPNVVYLGGAWQKGRWKTSIGWKFASGQYTRSFTIIQAENNFNRALRKRPKGAPLPPNPFKDLPTRLPNIHHLDVSASYTIPKTDKRDWSCSIGLSIYNLYNQKNQTDYVVRATQNITPNLLPRYGMRFAPNLMVIFEW